MYAQTEIPQTEQKLLTLKGEIRLLEGRRDNLTKEVERVQAIKLKELPQLQEKTRILKKEYQDTEIELVSLKKELGTLTDALIQAKAGLKFFTESEIAKINTEITIKLSGLELKEAELIEREESIQEILLVLKDAEDAVEQKNISITQREIDSRQFEKDLHQLEEHLEIRSQKSTSDLIAAKVELQGLTDKITELKGELETSSRRHANVKEETEKLIKEAENRVHTIERLEREVLAKTQFNKEWEDRLHRQEEQQNQAQQAITRNVDKLREKGIII